MSKVERVLEALESGDELTTKQIAARFGAGNPAEVVRTLRSRGYAVYANARKNSKGVTKTFYKLGRPRREVVAAGYALLGSSSMS